jgi:hypothetical protein
LLCADPGGNRQAQRIPETAWLAEIALILKSIVENKLVRVDGCAIGKAKPSCEEVWIFQWRLHWEFKLLDDESRMR